MGIDFSGPASLLSNRMRSSQKNRPDTPQLSQNSRGIKRKITEVVQSVKRFYDSSAKRRYAQLLQAYSTDASHKPSWSHTNHNNPVIAKSFAPFRSSLGLHATPIKSIQDYVIRGDTRSSPFEIQADKSSRSSLTTTPDRVDFQRSDNDRRIEYETRLSLRKNPLQPNKHIPSGPVPEKVVHAGQSALTEKSFDWQSGSFSFKPDTEPIVTFRSSNIFSSSSTLPSGANLLDVPTTIDLSPPSSTPAHSPQSSSSLNHRSNSTPITASNTSLLTTAPFNESKKRIEDSIKDLKLNETDDYQLIAAREKIHQAEKERREASQHLSQVSTRPVPQPPVTSNFLPLRVYSPQEDEEEEEDEEDYESDEEEKQVPSLSVIEEYIGPKLSNVGDNEILIEKEGCEIRTKDLATLDGLNWLNDEVINFYFQLIAQRSRDERDRGVDNFPSVYVFSTFFYDKLRASENSYSTLRRWTRRVDIFAHDYILIPLHLGMHWALASINCKKKRICYYDSLTSSALINENGRVHQAAILNYLKLEHKDKKQGAELPSDWSYCQVGQDEDDKSNVTIPQQHNGSDCGVFTCKFADNISRRCPFKFSQSHMAYIRRRMVYEILRGQLVSNSVSRCN